MLYGSSTGGAQEYACGAGGPRRGEAATWRRRPIEGVTDKNFDQPMGDYITSIVLPLVIKRTKFSSY
mgnify:FL=1